MLSKHKGINRWLFRIFRKNETEIHELNYLFWECTWRCNLSCRHCGSDCQSETYVPDMPFADFLKAIEPLETRYKKNNTIIAITGGGAAFAHRPSRLWASIARTWLSLGHRHQRHAL